MHNNLVQFQRVDMGFSGSFMNYSFLITITGVITLFFVPSLFKASPGILAIVLNALLTSFIAFRALLHVLNHSFFKSLLSFSVGSGYQQTHTCYMGKLGGLAKQNTGKSFSKSLRKFFNFIVIENKKYKEFMLAIFMLTVFNVLK